MPIIARKKVFDILASYAAHVGQEKMGGGVYRSTDLFGLGRDLKTVSTSRQIRCVGQPALGII